MSPIITYNGLTEYFIISLYNKKLRDKHLFTEIGKLRPSMKEPKQTNKKLEHELFPYAS